MLPESCIIRGNGKDERKMYPAHMLRKQAMNVEKQIIALFCVMFDTEYSKWFAKEMNESIVIEKLHYSLQPTFVDEAI